MKYGKKRKQINPEEIAPQEQSEESLQRPHHLLRTDERCLHLGLLISVLISRPLLSGLVLVLKPLVFVITSLPKVIWEEGRVAALSHTYAVKSPSVTMAHPKFAPKITSSRGPIPKPHYLLHPWTRPTYDANDAKRHPDPIRRFSTMLWTD